MIGYMPLLLIFTMQMVGVGILHQIQTMERRWLALSIAVLTLLSTILLWSPAEYSSVFSAHFTVNPQRMLLASSIQVGAVSLILLQRRADIQTSALPWMLTSLLFESLTIVATDVMAVIALAICSTIVSAWYIRQYSRAYALYAGLTILSLLVAGIGFYGNTGTEDPPLWAIFAIILAGFVRLGVFPFSSGILSVLKKTGFSIPSMITMLPMSGVAIMYIDQPLLDHVPEVQSGLLYYLGVVALLSVFLSLRQMILSKAVHYAFGGMESILLLAVLISHNSTATYLLWVNLLLSSIGIVSVFHILQARVGRMTLDNYNGLQAISPLLGVYFLFLLGAYAAFPGFLGFISLDGFLHSVGLKHFWLLAGIVVSITTVGFALMRVYFKVFMGPYYNPNASMALKMRENIGLLILSVLLLICGLFPNILL